LVTDYHSPFAKQKVGEPGIDIPYRENYAAQMPKRHLLSFLLVCLLSCFSFAQGQSGRTITIIYVNDFHAAMEPIKATWLVDQPNIGGARDFAAWIAMLRRQEPDPFVFDSGDLYTGQAISTLTRGQALRDLWKAIGFDAVCYGNHEFDYGFKGADAYAAEEPFPVLAANLFYRDTGKPYARPYTIVEKYGMKVGVIGVFGVDAVPSTYPTIWNTIEARDPAPILNKLVPELRKQVDLIVVLAHQGETGPMQTDAEAHPEVQRNFDADKALVAAVPGIDVFVGGHAHRGIEIPWVSPKTGSIVVQTYGHGTTIGVLKLRLNAQKKIISHSGGLIRVTNGVFDTPPAVEQTITHWEQEGDRIGQEKIATLQAPLKRSYDTESAIGDLIADALLAQTGAQIAFENSGGIRADLAAGVVTRYDLVSALPFFNTVATAQMTGKQVRELLEQSLTLKVGMMQEGGLEVRYDPSLPKYHRVISATVAGKPLDDATSYKVATNSFLVYGGDHYDMFLRATGLHDTGENIVDAVAEYMKTHSPVAAPKGGRLVSVKH